MLARDDAFLEIMKIVLLTFSLFSEIQDNCSLQESFFSPCKQVKLTQDGFYMFTAMIFLELYILNSKSKDTYYW
jgi:hypothetical protein